MEARIWWIWYPGSWNPRSGSENDEILLIFMERMRFGKQMMSFALFFKTLGSKVLLWLQQA